MSYPASMSVGASLPTLSRLERERLAKDRAERAHDLVTATLQLNDCKRNRARSAERIEELESRAYSRAVTLATSRTTFGLDELGKIETALLIERRIVSAYDTAQAEIEQRIAKLEVVVDADRAEQAAEAAEQRKSDLCWFVSWSAQERHVYLQRRPLAERQRFIADLSPSDRARWDAERSIEESKDCDLPMPWERK